MRLANHGQTMVEIAEELALPPALGDEFFNRDYYGTVNHDVKAVYQKYFGFFDGNPANLHAYPPVDAARRYVEYMGGADAVVARARDDYERGDYRWVAQVVNHVVFAAPHHEGARALQADALEQLGYQAESGPWRNFYLTGAMELRTGEAGRPGLRMGAGLLRNVTLSMVLDALAVRLHGERAGDAHIAVNLVDTGTGTEYGVWLGNGVLHHRVGHPFAADDAQLTIRADHDAMAAILFGFVRLDDAVDTGPATYDGDADALAELQGYLDAANPAFPIVLP
jgi:alkyl sulfatase BDS1-like metallo-beta-lactamase superfamily hydrolase